MAALLQAVPASDPIHDVLMAGALQVRAVRQNIEMRLDEVFPRRDRYTDIRFQASSAAIL